MTIASDVNRSGPYNGNGVTTVFDYDFKVVSETHLQVIKRDAAKVETVLTLGTHYTVSGVGNAGGGSITMTAAPASGDVIIILLDVPFTQDIDLENQGAYYAETVEAGFDLAAQRDLQMMELLARTVKLPPTAPISDLGDLALDIERLADSADEIDTVAGIAEDIPTAASLAPIIADIVTVAAISDDVSTVADIHEDVSALADIDEKISTVADNLADVNNFADIWLGPKASNPTTRNDGTELRHGDAYFNTTKSELRIWDLSKWQPAIGYVVKPTPDSFVGNGVETDFTLSLSANDDADVIVWQEGVRQRPTVDYTVDGATLTFATAPANGDAIDTLVISSVTPSAVVDAAASAAASALAAQNSAEDATEIVTGLVFADDDEMDDPDTAGKLVDPKRLHSFFYRKHGRIITPEMCKAKNAFDDTEALQLYTKVCRLERRPGLATGTYHFGDSIPFKAWTEWEPTEEGIALPEFVDYGTRRSSRFIADMNNKRATIVQGRGVSTEALQVEYLAGQGMNCPNSYGIAYRDLTFCEIDILKSVRAAKNGIDRDFVPPSGKPNFFWSNRIGIQWMAFFSHFGLNLATEVTGYGTPCDLGHIYVDGRYAPGSDGEFEEIIQTGNVVRVRKGAEFGVQIKRINSLPISSLNLERCAAGTAGLLRVEDADLQVSSLHLEGVAIAADFAAMIRTVGGTIKAGNISPADIDMGQRLAKTGGRFLSVTKYLHGHPTGRIAADSIRFSGQFWGGTNAVFAHSEIPDAIDIGAWHDDTVPIEIIPPEELATFPWPFLASTFFLDRYGMPKTSRTPWAQGGHDTGPGPSNFMVLNRFNGKQVMPSVRVVGGGGTHSTINTVVPLTEPSGSPGLWHDPFNMHGGGVITFPSSGLYMIQYRMVPQFNGNMTIKLRTNATTDHATFSSSRSGGAYPDARDYEVRQLLLKVRRGDTLAAHLTAGGVALGNDTFLEATMISPME